MNMKTRNTKAASARPRKLTAKEAALKRRLVKEYAAFDRKVAKRRAEYEARANRAVCVYVPKAHKAWIERRAEEEGKTPSEFLALIIKLAYDCAK